MLTRRIATAPQWHLDGASMRLVHALDTMAARRPQPTAPVTCAGCGAPCRDRARLEGARLVARTAAHRLNNALALVVGYTELLAQHPAVRHEPRLAAFARAAREGGIRAAEDLARLQRIVRLVEDSSVALPFPVLDLDRSTAPEGHSPGHLYPG